MTDLLTKYSYPFLANAHKLLVVFLSLNIYIASIDHLLKRLDKNTIKITENEIFDVSYFEEPYQSAMKDYLSIYREYYAKESRLTKDILLEKIIPKFSPVEQKSSGSSENSSISGTSSTKSVTPAEVIEAYPEIKVLLDNFKEGVNFSKSHYLQKFKELLFSEKFYHSEEDIRKFFYQEDMVIYYLMLIVAHQEDILNWKYEYMGNEMPKLR